MLQEWSVWRRPILWPFAVRTGAAMRGAPGPRDGRPILWPFAVEHWRPGARRPTLETTGLREPAVAGHPLGFKHC
jgi:hypothetical protein